MQQFSDIAITQLQSRQFSSAPKTCLVINSIGADRPGIVADVTRIVTEMGGNVGESHSLMLGGHFSLMMHVEIGSSVTDELGKHLQDVNGMTTNCFEAIDQKKVEVSPKIGCK